MQNTTHPLTYRVVRARRSCGRNGYPAVWFVFEIHARRARGEQWHALLRKDDTPRTFKTRQAARAAIRRLRAAE